MRINAMTEKFESVTVLNHPMLFTCLRVDRDTVPSDLYLYEVRHDNDGMGDPVQIARWVLVNHYGTLITDTPLPLEESTVSNNASLDIDPKRDWGFNGFCSTVKEYTEVPHD